MQFWALQLLTPHVGLCLHRQASLAHCRLLHHLISSAQEAAWKPRTFPSGPAGCKNLAGLPWGDILSSWRETDLGCFPSFPVPKFLSWKGEQTSDTDDFLPWLSVVLFLVLQSILSLTLWWTQKIFSANIHTLPNPFLHGLLIQSIFHFHADCRICAGVWVFLLQQIPPSLLHSLHLQGPLLD